jgi:molybdopterin molybdotransferase
MVSVAEAERIVLEQARHYGTEKVRPESAVGRVLAEDVSADRDIPSYDRATMDGIAIKYKDFAAGQRGFELIAVQAAGDKPVNQLKAGTCVRIMTGAAVPSQADTVVPIENVIINDKTANISGGVTRLGQFIHKRGSDKSAGSVVLAAGQVLTPAAVSIAASVGQKRLAVNRPPRILFIATGDELVGIGTKPTAYQIRGSNDYAVRTTLARFGAAVDVAHLPDNPAVIKARLKKSLASYDVLIISGGVSKGKFDFVPDVLADLSVKTLFHGVRQKPGKPFWFGAYQAGTVVFALPGNPVSTFLCLHKYFLPWLRASLGVPAPAVINAVLEREISRNGSFHNFVPAKLRTDANGRLAASPIRNNGSGDFLSLLETDIFLELPPRSRVYKKGEVRRALGVKTII